MSEKRKSSNNSQTDDKAKRKHILNSIWVCRHCFAKVPYASKRKHLRQQHGIFVDDTKPHFMSVRDYNVLLKQRESETRLRKYMNNLKKVSEGKLLCGSVVYGAPKVKIIYNALETNRRKH